MTDGSGRPFSFAPRETFGMGAAMNGSGAVRNRVKSPMTFVPVPLGY